MSVFPFVIIPEEATSDSLRSNHPFTWKALMLQACMDDGHRQQALGKEVLQELSEALLTRPRKSLDLLQGLILFVAWHHSDLTSFQSSNLLGLARSLCFSLGFHEGRMGDSMKNSTFGATPACLERMRAFAGTYYLITSIYTTSKITDAFMNTTYLEQLCGLLESRAVYPTDKLVAYLLRGQKLAQNISLNLSNSSNSQFVLLPTMMIVKNLQSQVENFKASLPEDLRDNDILMSNLHTAEALLYEVGLQEVGPGAGGLEGTDRLEVLWSLLTCSKAFFALRLGGPKDCYVRFPCISSVDFMYMFITSLKLITLHAPGWDLARVRQDLKLPELVDRQIQELEAGIQFRKRRNCLSATGNQWTMDPLVRLVTVLKGIAAAIRTMPEPAPMTPLVHNDAPPSTNAEEAEFDMGIVSGLVPDSWPGLWAPDDQNFDGDWTCNSPMPELPSV